MAELSRRSSPYQGLIPFTESDASYFFGREKETRLIVANLFASPLTILYGASGVGKSSVLQAGVANELNRRQNLKVIVQSDWREDPLARLKALAQAQSGPAIDPGLFLGEYLRQATFQGGTRLMIILDQFEEYFLYHPEQDEFTRQFALAVIQPGLPASFLISIREDQLAKLDRFEGRIPILFDNYLRLDHLDDAAAKSAIVGPVERYNQLHPEDKAQIRIEQDLVDEVLSQLKTGRVSLSRTGPGRNDLDSTGPGRIETPYLQLVMTRIWGYEMAKGSRTLRLATLKLLGGAEKIVRTHLDSVMKRLSSDHQLLAAQIFQYLVTPSGAKIALSAADLASFVDLPSPVVRSLLQRLAEPDVRLLRAVEGDEKTGISYEIFHDVLATPILDWRERWLAWYNFKRRSLMLAFVLIFLVGMVALLFTLMGSSGDVGIPGVNIGLTCVAPVLVLAFLFGIIGFIAGMNWARTK